MALRYDLTDLELFLAIAETGNLTRGAGRANLAPSSASHRIKQLEETLGAALFERQARGVRLTPAGQTLLGHARQLFAQLERMHGELAPFARGIRARVSLWANTHATHTFLPDDLADFLRFHPQVSVSLEEHTSPDIVEAVAKGEAELGVVAELPGESILGAGVRFLPYRQDRLVLVVPAVHPLAARAAAPFADTLDYPFVMLHAGSAIHRFTVQAAATLGRPLDVRIQVRSFDAVCRMVGAGVGIGLVPRSAVAGLKLREPPALVELDEPWARRDLKLCVRDEAALSGFARELLSALVDAGARSGNGLA